MESGSLKDAKTTKDMLPAAADAPNDIVGTPNQGYLKRDSQIKREEDSGKIEFIVVKNDK